MPMKGIIHRIACGLGVILFAAAILRLTLPVSPRGFWTGSSLQCMCGHGFAHFTGTEGTLYIGCDEPLEGWLALLVRQNRVTWHLELHDFKLNSNRTDYTMLTNRVMVCEPGWFWMKCTDMPEGKQYRLRRDFSRRSRQIVDAGTPALTTEQQVDRLLKRIK